MFVNHSLLLYKIRLCRIFCNVHIPGRWRHSGERLEGTSVWNLNIFKCIIISSSNICIAFCSFSEYVHNHSSENFSSHSKKRIVLFHTSNISTWNFYMWFVQSALQRQNAENSKQMFPEKEYRGFSPNFHINVSVSELYIPTMGLLFLLEEICGPILGIYKSLTDTWMWKLGPRPRNSQKRNI